MNLLDDFLVRALLAGIGVALAAAPLGCFLVWRRMAYFGDATAHAAILGVALALVSGTPVFAGVLIVALAMAGGVTALASRTQGVDTALGVLSYSALAAGLVAVSLAGGVRPGLEAFLFGDILAVGRGDVAVIWAGALVTGGLMLWRWRALLTATLSEELAFAAGLDPRREQLVLTLALALVVAIAIKVVGALLIGALLIIPAAAARPLARAPETMAALAACLGVAAVCLGLWGAWRLDTLAGPSIVCAAALIFALARIAGGLRR